MQKFVGVQTRAAAEGTVITVLLGLSVSHMLNDTMQSLLPALYPMLKTGLGLNYGEIGLITLAFQLTASLLQPLVGIVTDRKPMPYSLAAGMGFTLLGLLLLSAAGSFAAVLVAAATIGLGSSIFHPEASRMARYASGGRHGLAQSLFQVGGNAGSALGPLLAAFIVVPNGQRSVAYFSAVALLAMAILASVGRWYVRRQALRGAKARRTAVAGHGLSSRRVAASIAILIALRTPVQKRLAYGRTRLNGSTPRIETQMTYLRPSLSPSGPPKNVPTAVAARNTNRFSCAVCTSTPNWWIR